MHVLPLHAPASPEQNIGETWGKTEREREEWKERGKREAARAGQRCSAFLQNTLADYKCPLPLWAPYITCSLQPLQGFPLLLLPTYLHRGPGSLPGLQEGSPDALFLSMASSGLYSLKLVYWTTHHLT